ncbi:MAG: sulfurtransferase [endosymbiont of Galathealinum brachiosum]|uniref:Sulfurtransferase n=1 Tax=endosymbiont of Galathealinum brachiosum TaxID=2200906 RepID=A0A370DG74_9GAMM|nr:MAG: sulfurtransferase [endosymbiont of Galathealinum brachiosum]
MKELKQLELESLNHLSPQEAVDILEQKSSALLIDIRSNMEFLFVGHPKGALHVPWIDEPDWCVNPYFEKEIRQLMLGGICDQGESTPPIILICRSGKRSIDAGNVLLEAGFHNVCHITEGFEGDRDSEYHRSSTGGWRYRGFPWEQC